jgi:hypothetical protein
VKRGTKIYIVLGVLLALGGIVIWQWDSILRAYVFHSVRTVTINLPRCDRVEVFHIRGSGMRHGADAATGFPVRGYGTFSTILGRQTVSGSDAESFAALWRAQTFDPDLQGLCHSPPYGFRFYSGSKLLFETSLCYHCANFYVSDLTGSYWWGFNPGTPKAGELLQRLQQMFPASIPTRK